MYFETTVNLSMKEALDRFLELVPEGGAVLDLGCGSGRDSLEFIKKGYNRLFDLSINLICLMVVYRE